MNNEGFGSNSVPFEYTITKKGKIRSVRRLILILLYIAWVVLFFTVGVLVRLILPLLCFIPLSLWILVFFTWRWTNEEIKLSFFGGGLKVIRMYDGKNEKILSELRIKDMRQLAPYSEELIASLDKRSIIYAIKNKPTENAYIAVWEELALVFEANERALRIIQYYRGKN